MSMQSDADKVLRAFKSQGEPNPLSIRATARIDLLEDLERSNAPGIAQDIAQMLGAVEHSARGSYDVLYDQIFALLRKCADEG